MTRRKGEQPVRVPLTRWSADHPVAEMMADGDGWLDAWMRQNGPTLSRLAQVTGIPSARLWTMLDGGDVSRAEIDAFARVWCVSAGDLIASLPESMKVID